MNKPIGFIGLGNMGLPMARLLLKRGYTVHGFDVNEEACQIFAKCGGIRSSLSDIVQNVSTIVLMLPNSLIVNDVVGQIRSHFLSLNGRNSNETTIIDMSSSFPSDTRNNARLLSETGIKLLDAPVSGGVKKAITGNLTIMVGGDKEVFEEQLEMLKTFGNNIFYAGGSGSGHLIKSLNNFLSAVHMLATCEAVQVLSNFGIDPQTGIEVFNHSTGRSVSTEYKFPEFVLTGKFNSGFSLELLVKDIEITRRLLEESGDPTPLVKLISDTYKTAGRFLDAKADHTEIFRYVSSYIQK